MTGFRVLTSIKTIPNRCGLTNNCSSKKNFTELDIHIQQVMFSFSRRAASSAKTTAAAQRSLWWQWVYVTHIQAKQWPDAALGSKHIKNSEKQRKITVIKKRDIKSPSYQSKWVYQVLKRPEKVKIYWHRGKLEKKYLLICFRHGLFCSFVFRWTNLYLSYKRRNKGTSRWHLVEARVP